MTTRADLLNVMMPGEQLPYVQLLARLREHGIETAGVGMMIDSFRARPRYTDPEFAAWREPCFDHEDEGWWCDGRLMIARAESP